MSKTCPIEIENGKIDNTFADYLKDTKWTKSKLKRNQSSVFKPFVFKGVKFSSAVGSKLIIDADFYKLEFKQKNRKEKYVLLRPDVVSVSRNVSTKEFLSALHAKSVDSDASPLKQKNPSPRKNGRDDSFLNCILKSKEGEIILAKEKFLKIIKGFS